MLSGRRLDLLDPSPLDIELDDIAHGLARVARWNGQTAGDHAFSVAQHCLLVEQVLCAQEHAASRRDRLATLLHDAPEYVIGDMISPFKAVLDGAYKAVEARLLAAIHLRFGLPATNPDELAKRIKKADHIAAYWEATRLAGFSETEAVRFFGRPGRGCDCRSRTPAAAVARARCGIPLPQPAPCLDRGNRRDGRSAALSKTDPR
jgi:5'-deoxynucleotidase YfbR-like HD superfamily hydrolase